MILCTNVVQKGEVIVLNAGTYKMKSAVTVPAGVTIVGANAGISGKDWKDTDDSLKTIINVASEDGLLILEDAGFVKIDGIEINCMNSFIKAVYSYSTDESFLRNIVITNNIITNSADDGINLSNTYRKVPNK